MKWLLDKLTQNKNNIAIANKHNIYYNIDIIDQYYKWKKTLSDNQVKQGDIVAIIGNYSPEVCGMLFALIENKNIIVPVSSSLPQEKISEYFKIVVPKFICTPLKITKFSSDLPQYELTQKLIDNNNCGLILFTSGSSGTPKAVVHNFDKLLCKYKKPGAILSTLTFLLVDHIGGINTLFYALANGGMIVTAKTRNTSEICQLIQQHKVELLPTTPSFLKLLLISEQYKQYDLSSLKIITYGTEVMSEATLKRLHEIFPKVNIKQTYGLSELGIIKTKSKSSNSLWMKISDDQSKIKIVDNILHVKCDTAMLGYLNAPSLFDKNGWFNTQDQVAVNGDYIKILGRKSEIINVGGQKVFPGEIENFLLNMSNIKDIAIKSEPNPILGNIIVAHVNLFLPEDIKSLRLRSNEFCKGRIEDYKIPMKFIVSNDNLYNERFKKIRR